MNNPRIAFHLGPLPIHWYGVFIALGFIAGMTIMQWRAKRAGLDPQKIPDVGVIAIIAGIVGARLFYVLSNWSDYADRPLEIIRVDHGGLVYYGGFFGATLGIILYCRWRDLDTWKVADLVGLGLPLGQAIGRLGCFKNGCCFGHPTDSVCGVHYDFPLTRTDGSYAPDAAVLPSQLSQSGINLAIFVIVLLLAPRLKRPGRLFAVYLGLYAIGRFVNEFFRGDYASIPYDALSGKLSQTGFALIPIVLVLAAWYLLQAKLTRNPQLGLLLYAIYAVVYVVMHQRGWHSLLTPAQGICLLVLPAAYGLWIWRGTAPAAQHKPVAT